MWKIKNFVKKFFCEIKLDEFRVSWKLAGSFEQFQNRHNWFHVKTRVVEKFSNFHTVRKTTYTSSVGFFKHAIDLNVNSLEPYKNWFVVAFFQLCSNFQKAYDPWSTNIAKKISNILEFQGLSHFHLNYRFSSYYFFFFFQINALLRKTFRLKSLFNICYCIAI